MKRTFLTLALVVAVAVGYAQEKNFIDQNYIEVNGYAEKKVIPNEIYLKIVLNEKDFKNKQLPEIEKSMIDKLKSIGIDVKKQLKVCDYTSNFKKYWLLKSAVVQEKEYQLVLSDAQTVAKTFLGLSSLGIANVSVEKVDHSDMQKLKMETKASAMQSAKQNATVLANAIGQEVGRALYISEGYEQPYRHSNVAFGLKATGAETDEVYVPDIEFEDIELRSTVIVRFELK
ncbi:MAG TPA: SIMPL domain-containing protein [Paludibacteraceae bacterium]|nr:SIMPL domain-containing protein [Paludibacteraceae bacterium]